MLQSNFSLLPQSIFLSIFGWGYYFLEFMLLDVGELIGFTGSKKLEYLIGDIKPWPMVVTYRNRGFVLPGTQVNSALYAVPPILPHTDKEGMF